jgi:hypothetical protein
MQFQGSLAAMACGTVVNELKYNCVYSIHGDNDSTKQLLRGKLTEMIIFNTNIYISTEIGLAVQSKQRTWLSVCEQAASASRFTSMYHAHCRCDLIAVWAILFCRLPF